MKRVWMVCGLAVAAALACTCVMAGEEPKAEETTLVGELSVNKDDAGKITEMNLLVRCKADCAGCEKDVTYSVTAANEEVGKKLAALDGKKVEVKGKVTENKDKSKTIAATAVKEAEAKKEEKKQEAGK